MTRRTVALTMPGHRQVPFAEYVHDTYVDDSGRDQDRGFWRIWQHFNNAATAGTFLELHSDGRVERVTIGPDSNIASTVCILPEM